MPPKKEKEKKKGNKGESGAAGPAAHFITLDDVRVREMKHNHRLVELRTCLALMDDANVEIDKIKALAREAERWNRYIRCDGLPKPFVPPEIRRLFVKMNFFEEKNIEKTINWLLSVDERSVLSQDIFRKDMTKKTLINDLRPNFGKDYEADIITALKVLKSMQKYLEDDKMVAMADPRVLCDLKLIRQNIIEEIRRFFNNFAYRILSAEDSYMDEVSAKSAEFHYACEAFIMHTWTLKNVPILFTFLTDAYIRVPLHSMHATVVLPYDILEENLTLRALHCNFDHYSENAKVHGKNINMPMEYSSGEILDIHRCLVNEWAIQVELQNELRAKIIERRREYDEKVELIEEELERKKKEPGFDAKADAGKKKKEKLPKEPPLLTEDMYPDIYHDFLDKEQQRYVDFLNASYNPHNMELQPSEINLKNYVILGGVYQFDFVEKPRHYQFNNFNMTWHVNDAELIIKKDVIVAQTLSDLSVQSSFSRQQRSVTRISRISARMSKVSRASRITFKKVEPEPDDDKEEEFEESTLFIVRIELPLYLCMWGEPQPCHFVGVDKKELPPEMSQETPPEAAPTGSTGVAETTTTAAAPVFTVASAAPSTAVSTSAGRGPSVQSTTSQPHFAGATAFQRSTEVPSAITLTRTGSLISRGSTLAFPRISTISTLASGIGYGTEVPRVAIDDFHLDRNLTKIQIRNMQRHCLPRMISSFKFPKEMAEEDVEEQKRRSKGTATLVKRKLVTDLEEEQKLENGLVFSSINQTNPERIFPIFPKLEPIPLQYKLGISYEDEEVYEENQAVTFSNFIGILDDIKRNYRTRFKEIVKVPALKKKLKIPNLNQIGKTAVKRPIKRKEPSADSATHDKKTGKPGERRKSVDRKIRRSVDVREVKDVKSSSKIDLDDEEKERRDKEKAEKVERLKIEKAEKAEKEKLEKERLEKEKAEQDLREKEEQTRRDLDILKKSVISLTIPVSQIIEPELPTTEESTTEDEMQEVQYAHWTKKHMKRIDYDSEKGKITLYTDRLGIIGFAYKRYEHFPLVDWSIGPSSEKPETEVILDIQTQYVRVIITISGEGYRAMATEIGRVMFEHKRIKYLSITEPLEDLKELKRRFLERNLNIFVERDSSFYIENGVFSEKHLPAELHTYSGIALHTIMLKFARCPLNFLTKRRDILLKFIHFKEPPENMITLRITPEESTFIEVNQVLLPEGGSRIDFIPTWRNLDFYVDLHNAIISMYPAAIDSHIKDARLITFTRDLLCAIRPLSYCS